jgi:hypothetical protein
LVTRGLTDDVGPLGKVEIGLGGESILLIRALSVSMLKRPDVLAFLPVVPASVSPTTPTIAPIAPILASLAAFAPMIAVAIAVRTAPVRITISIIILPPVLVYRSAVIKSLPGPRIVSPSIGAMISWVTVVVGPPRHMIPMRVSISISMFGLMSDRTLIFIAKKSISPVSRLGPFVVKGALERSFGA